MLPSLPATVVEFLRRRNDYTPLGREKAHGQRRVWVRYVSFLVVFILGLAVGSFWQPRRHLTNPTASPEAHARLLPLCLPPPLDTPVPGLQPPLDPVPNIVHYVYGLKSGHTEFPYYAFLAMRSAVVNLQPDKIMFHCRRWPSGYWWDRIMEWDTAGTVGSESPERLVEVVKARDVTSVGKAGHKVEHYAHKADILRLEILRDYGGVYLDIDTFILGSFKDAGLMQYETVLGMEAAASAADEMHPKGLCNAVIVARASAEFIKLWLDSYESFDKDKWSQHSVEMPWTLARLYPTLVTVLSERAFFWPLWTDEHLRTVHDTTEYDFDSGQLAYHAWESVAHSYLDSLDPVNVLEVNSSFTRMARRFATPNEADTWRAWLFSQVEPAQ